jgi:hypothetical protein
MVNPLGSKKQYKVLDGRDEWQGLPTSGEPIDFELPHGASVSATGLRLLDLEINIDQWSEIGAKLSNMHYSVQWAIGDWWAYGYRTYRDKAHKIVEKLPYTKESVMNLGTVARSVPPSLRNEALSFSHHVAVASLEHEDQKKWLKRAGGNPRWSVKKLRDSIAKQASDQGGPGFDPRKWARYIIECAQRPKMLVDPDFSGEFEQFDDRTLLEVAEASSAAAERWTRIADEAKRLQRERAPVKPGKRKREKIEEQQAAG